VKSVTNSYRAFRQLERKLFLAVPEHPESFWERDGNDETQSRLSGRSLQAAQVQPASLQAARTIATIIYRPKSGEILVEPATPRRRTRKSENRTRR
jgi:hypothetical protein